MKLYLRKKGYGPVTRRELMKKIDPATAKNLLSYFPKDSGNNLKGVD